MQILIEWLGLNGVENQYFPQVGEKKITQPVDAAG